MEIRILTLTKRGLAIMIVVLLGFVAAARADEGTGAITGIQRAIPRADHLLGGTGTTGKGAGAVAGGSRTVGATETPATPAGAGSAGAGGGEPSASTGTASAGSQPDRESDPAGPSAAAGAPIPAEPSSEPAIQPPPAVTAGSPDLATPSPEPDAAQASTTSISQAVREAILQATRQPHQSGNGHASTVAAESNATTQLIWQVQISACTAHCFGTTQSQTAEQKNSTLQVLTGAPPPANAPGTQATGGGSQSAVSVTQIQLGCVSHCFGTTTTPAASIVADYAQVLDELLGDIATGLPSLNPTPAADQNTVEQTSYQAQSDPDRTFVQMQSASQASATVQVYDAPSAPIADGETAPGGPQAATHEAVNQTEQGIRQLQIGCLMFCVETEQYQQAAQSNAAVQTVVSAPGSVSTTTAALADIATQIIWQAQVGCLFWCYDTTEQQTAKTQNTLTVIGSGRAAAPPPPETTSTSPGAGVKPAPPAPPGGSSTSTSSGASPGPSGATNAPATTPTVRVLEGLAIPSLTPATTVGKRRVRAPRSHRAAARAAVGSPVRPQLGVRPALMSLGAALRGGAAARVPVRRIRLARGSLAAGTALGSGERVVSNVPAAALLAAIVFCGLCILSIAVVRARRDPARATRATNLRATENHQQGDR